MRAISIPLMCTALAMQFLVPIGAGAQDIPDDVNPQPTQGSSTQGSSGKSPTTTLPAGTSVTTGPQGETITKVEHADGSVTKTTEYKPEKGGDPKDPTSQTVKTEINEYKKGETKASSKTEINEVRTVQDASGVPYPKSKVTVTKEFDKNDKGLWYKTKQTTITETLTEIDDNGQAHVKKITTVTTYKDAKDTIGTTGTPTIENYDPYKKKWIPEKVALVVPDETIARVMEQSFSIPAEPLIRTNHGSGLRRFIGGLLLSGGVATGIAVPLATTLGHHHHHNNNNQSNALANQILAEQQAQQQSTTPAASLTSTTTSEIVPALEVTF